MKSRVLEGMYIEETKPNYSDQIGDEMQYSTRDDKQMQGPVLFIDKLYAILQDESLNEIIGWDESGKSFIIHDTV